MHAHPNKIGIFDSGLGGLFTMKAIAAELPEYDYVYLGDTARLPYGTKTHDEIFSFLKEGIDFLFTRGCRLIIVACNSASAEALRQFQEAYPEKKVLGMIVPMTEACAAYRRVGLIATEATVHSGAYPREFKKRAPGVELEVLAAPKLVPLIEAGDIVAARAALKEYLSQFKDIDALLLGCTHYAIVRDEIKNLLPEGVAIVSQDSVVPGKTRDYLARHPEIEVDLSRGGTREFFVTDLGEHFKKTAALWFGADILIQKCVLD
jgi:glutamate racemase